MERKSVLEWLLNGDVSIQYQVHRDLLATEREDLQKRISKEGFGAKFLSKRKADGNWGIKFYQPKWTSTHYTLFDLRNLCITPNNPLIKESIKMILENEKADDGGLLPIGKTQLTDLCINGMFLNYASYFKTNESDLKSVIDCILAQTMPDGGFNCRSNRFPTIHSSLHTTLSVLEGITEYELNTYKYRLKELVKAKKSALEFILKHQLFRSDRTGEIIKQDFLKFSYPRRWRYDILSALDYFQHSKTDWDERMRPAIETLLKKRNKEGTWNLRAKYPGQTHFDMEKAGQPSRWNTLRALRVLKHFKMDKNLYLAK
ncbi:MAG: hypothetical protein P8K68_08655 [Algibacter sp.]|uniref:hypothetical protein n=1 Tax=Algibacter sp. TaxID=1872428 RepID=UPI002636D853|nr:hypothetical protein [Algibacter sp.]MDG1730363.1 hypothetical protein [Algibacter sp.]MDG2178841.1 hypothetical protein [Algibacter sp.]